MVRRGLNAAMDIILPRVCIVCGRRLLADEKHICLVCLADMPMTRFWEQSHNVMADKFNGIIQEKGGYGERYAFAAALFFYHNEADYRHIPYQIKYHGNIQAGHYFGEMLGKKLAASPFFGDVDVVIPVPLHWARRWKRGYNQAQVIAEGVADTVGCRMMNDILKRHRRTKTQTKVAVEKKSHNVEGAFRLSSDAADRLAGVTHVLLIDDVFTTGSTLHECFRALRTVFPEVRISVATLGFVGRA